MSSERLIELIKDNIDIYLKEVAKEYPGVTKEANVDAIAGNLQKQADKASILAQLRQKKPKVEQTIQEKPPRKRNAQET